MNGKNLVVLIAVAATAALYGCASDPTPHHVAAVRQEISRAPGIAANAWSECVQAAIPGLDDHQSSSESVARAAMKSCANDYQDMVRARTQTIATTCGRDAVCARGTLATAEREAIQAATDDVMTERVRLAGAQVLVCQ